jgi:hypothetical protein
MIRRLGGPRVIIEYVKVETPGRARVDDPVRFLRCSCLFQQIEEVNWKSNDCNKTIRLLADILASNPYLGNFLEYAKESHFSARRQSNTEILQVRKMNGRHYSLRVEYARR